MVFLILGAVAVVIVLVLVKMLTIPIALVAILVALLYAAWRLDRARGIGASPPYLDANRPDFYGGSGESSWEVPTAYIDHPTGGGPPPGVERGGEPPPRR